MGNNLTTIDLGTDKTAKQSANGSLVDMCYFELDIMVKCWGYGNFGQLGYGDPNNRGDGPNQMGNHLPVVDLGTNKTAKQLSAGDKHTCAILNDDTVKCWGRGYDGQLGYSWVLVDESGRGDNPNEMGDNLPAVDLGLPAPTYTYDSRCSGTADCEATCAADSSCAGYSKITAPKPNAGITVWGHSDYGASGAPTTGTYVKLFSNLYAFVALKSDGSISAWGSSNYGGSGAPTDNGYVDVFSTYYAFASRKADGSISVWGDSNWGGSGAPTDNGYVTISSTTRAFVARKADGSITAWGDSNYGGSAPSGTFVNVFSSYYAFAALKADGSITAWGDSSYGGSGAPSGTGFVNIFSTFYAFAALKDDGSIAAWGILIGVVLVPLVVLVL